MLDKPAWLIYEKGAEIARPFDWVLRPYAETSRLMSLDKLIRPKAVEVRLSVLELSA